MIFWFSNIWKCIIGRELRGATQCLAVSLEVLLELQHSFFFVLTQTLMLSPRHTCSLTQAQTSETYVIKWKHHIVINNNPTIIFSSHQFGVFWHKWQNKHWGRIQVVQRWDRRRVRFAGSFPSTDRRSVFGDRCRTFPAFFPTASSSKIQKHP